MGLLDWITDMTGSTGPMPTMESDGSPLRGPEPVAAPPAPTPPPMAQDPAAISGPVPMPMPRPPEANGPQAAPPLPMPINVPAPPPVAAARPDGMTSPQMLPPDAAGALAGYRNAGGQAFEPGNDVGKTAQAKTILGRALGLDPNMESQMRGSLGKSLQAVAANAHKPGLAAFSGALGAGIEGGKAADDKTADQQGKYLDRQMKANQEGITNELNRARTKLALAQAENGGGGRDSVINSYQQLYLRANKMALEKSKLSADGVKQALTAAGGDLNDPTYKKALQAHNDLVEKLTAQESANVGLSPEMIKKFKDQPGMSESNPVPKEGLTREKFDKLPVGSFFINPKDGRLLIKKPPAAKPTGPTPATPAQSGLPPLPTSPAPVTAPAGSAADDLE